MDSSTSLDPMWPVCTKLVGFPIMDRSIRSRWWWRLRRGLCGWWKQHENHCSQISPVLAILPLFSFLSTLGPWFGVGPRVTEARVLPCTNKEALRTTSTCYGRLDRETSSFKLSSWHLYLTSRFLSEAKVSLRPIIRLHLLRCSPPI